MSGAFIREGTLIIFQNKYGTPTIYELPHDKTNKIARAPSKDLDQPGHPQSENVTRMTKKFGKQLDILMS